MIGHLIAHGGWREVGEDGEVHVRSTGERFRLDGLLERVRKSCQENNIEFKDEGKRLDCVLDVDMVAVVMGLYGMHLDPARRIVPFKLADAIVHLVNHPALNLGLLDDDAYNEKRRAIHR